MSLTPPAPEEPDDSNLRDSVPLPSEVVQPVLRFMEQHGIGRMSLNVEALDSSSEELESPRTLMSTAVLEREDELYSDETPQGGLMGVFIVIESQ